MIKIECRQIGEHFLGVMGPGTPSQPSFIVHSRAEMEVNGLGMNASGQIIFKVDQDREGTAFSLE